MNRIEIHHINQTCQAVTDGTFPVYWTPSGESCRSDILASRTIDGQKAEALANLLKRVFTGLINETLCGHYPDYGLRVLEGDAVTHETTICLSCDNWIGLLDGKMEHYRLTQAPENQGSSRERKRGL